MKIVQLLSGGMDSAVLLHHLLDEGHDVAALHVHYGQRHSKEGEFAAQMAESLAIPFEKVDLSGMAPLLKGSALTDPSVDVPDGHYEDESMKETVVPNRNMIMLAVAAGWAISAQYDAVGYANHSGDHAIYPDCRPEFVQAIGNLLKVVDYSPVLLVSPFVDKTKADIVALGHTLGVEFIGTWSCYQGRVYHCGICGTCVERREAFALAEVGDPTTYEIGGE